MTNDELFQATNNAVQATGVIGAAAGNRFARKWAEKQAKIVRQQNLDDWNMQNEYNSPTSQMARLREAGLNPNLVYGKGADNTAQAVAGQQAPSYQRDQPDYKSLGSSLFVHADLAMKAAQTDNLKVQNTVLLQDQLLKQAQTAQTMENAATTKQQRDFAASLFPGQLDMQKANIRELNQRTDFQFNDEQRKAAMHSQSMQQGLQNLLKLEIETNNLKLSGEQIKKTMDAIDKDNALRDLDLNLKRMGLQPTDNMFLRILAQKWKEWYEKLSTTPFKKNDPVFPGQKFNPGNGK